MPRKPSSYPPSFEETNKKRKNNTFNYIRRSLRDGRFDDFTGWTQLNLGKTNFVNKKILSYLEFSFSSMEKHFDFETEFAFARLRIMAGSEEISKFLKLSTKLERYFLNNEFNLAIKKLDEIDDEVGLSLWGIDTRLAILSLSDEKKQLEAFLEKVSRIAKDTFITGYVVHQKIKMESGSNAKALKENLKDRLSRFESLPNDLKIYLLYRIAGILPENKQEISDILYNENGSSVIDIYTTVRELYFKIEDFAIKAKSLQSHDLEKILKVDEKLFIESKYARIENISEITNETYAEKLVKTLTATKGSESDLSQIDSIEYKLARTRVSEISLIVSKFLDGSSQVSQSDVERRARYFNFSQPDNIITLIKSMQTEQEIFMSNILSEAMFAQYDSDCTKRILQRFFVEDLIVLKKYKIISEIDFQSAEETFNSIVNNVIYNKVPAYQIPITYVNEKLANQFRDHGIGTINSVIFSYLAYSLNPSKALYDQTREEFDLFLFNENISIPHEINLDLYDNEKVLFFLQFICIPEILDHYYELSTEKLLIEERLKCLEKLLTIDSSKIGAVKDELVSILNWLANAKAVDSLNSSKLRIDEKRIINVLLEKIGYDYLKMLGSLTDEEIRDKEILLHKLNEERVFHADFSTINNDSTSALLYFILESIKNEYLFNHQAGLSQALGTRIRHNIFLEELTKPLIDEKIYLKKGDVKKELILAKWLSNTSLSKDQIASLLDGFTVAINKIIESFKDKYIRINNKDSKFGVFDIKITPILMNLSIGLIERDQSVEDFIRQSIEVFETHTLHKNVVLMREKIENELSRSLKDEIDKLFRKFLNSALTPEVENTVRTLAVRMKESLVTVSKWFSLESSITANQVYRPDESIDIAINAAKKMNFELDFENIVISTEEMQFTVWVHDIIVYSLIILLDNSSKYASFGLINIHITSQDQKISIIFKNVLTNDAARLKLENHWVHLRDAIDREEVKRMTTAEGGSGLARIYSMISFSKERTFNILCTENEAVFEFSFSVSDAKILVSEMGKSA